MADRIQKWLTASADSEAPPSPIISSSGSDTTNSQASLTSDPSEASTSPIVSVEANDNSEISQDPNVPTASDATEVTEDSAVNTSGSSGCSAIEGLEISENAIAGELSRISDTDELDTSDKSVRSDTSDKSMRSDTSDKAEIERPPVKAAEDGRTHIKIICLGDSAVGKSKLVERFLLSGYKERALSTHALTTFEYETVVDGEPVHVDIWDTAGQEKFNHLHPTYYYDAHACVIVFDCTRKVTYRNIIRWYKELKQYRSEIPCLCAANKIDANPSVTNLGFRIPTMLKLPVYFVSASDGTNVVKLFKDAIRCALMYKKNSPDFFDTMMEELEAMAVDEERTVSEFFDKQADLSGKRELSVNESCDKPSSSLVTGNMSSVNKPCDKPINSPAKGESSIIDVPCDILQSSPASSLGSSFYDLLNLSLSDENSEKSFNESCDKPTDLSDKSINE